MPVWLVTGGAGFIGSNFVLTSLKEQPSLRIVTLDKLTYAGNRGNLAQADQDGRHELVVGDICDGPLVSRLLETHKPDALVHFAAESHVDRSIDGPSEFVETNVVGTFKLLDASRHYLANAAPDASRRFRFLHVSTDEVFGSLGADGHFSEASPYAPSSPYAASKAAADHFVRAYARTYSVPALVTNCSNNYGSYQFPEKLIPLTILNALEGKPLPVYGDGKQVRDWLYVNDHCDALRAVLAEGKPGETYNIGGNNERNNLELVNIICDLLEQIRPFAENDSVDRQRLTRYQDLITFVTDRPGHDRRYAIDASKIARELGWTARTPLSRGLRDTVEWYVGNRAWCREAASRYARNRLGLAGAPSK